jgi:hypothetical protein
MWQVTRPGTIKADDPPIPGVRVAIPDADTAE